MTKRERKSLKSLLRKIAIGLCSVVMFLCCGLAVGNMFDFGKTVSAAMSDPTGSITFTTGETYEVDSRLKSFPRTYEAVVKLTDSTDDQGVIIGSLGASADADEWGTPSFSLRIGKNRQPKLYYVYQKSGGGTGNSGGYNNGVFSDVTLPANEWIHLAITHSGSTATCYVNGVAVGTLTVPDIQYSTSVNTALIGCDHRGGDGNTFDGNLAGLELYSDARTANEIAADALRGVSAVTEGDNLIAAYDFTQAGDAGLYDLSGNDYDITHNASEGFAFTQNARYYVDDSLLFAPQTIAVSFKFDDNKNTTEHILSSASANDDVSSLRLSLRYSSSGTYYYPQLYYVNDLGTALNITFTKTRFTPTEWNHLVITHSGTTATAYLNGALTETKTDLAELGEFTSAKPFIIGGNYHATNAEYFKGRIRTLEMYWDVRTAAEITADYNRGLGAPDTTDAGLMAAYNFTQSRAESLKDLSANAYNIDYVGSVNPNHEGLAPTLADMYEVEASLITMPKTFEAYVKLPGAWDTSKKGVIASNFGLVGDGYSSVWRTPAFSFDVHFNNNPRLYYTDPTTGVGLDFQFGDVVLPAETWVHLVIVNNGATMVCYVNGEYVQEITETIVNTNTGKKYSVEEISYVFDYTTPNPVRIGTDHNNTEGDENAQKLFEGNIRSVELYSDARTADEVKADYERLLTAKPTDSDCLVAYNFAQNGRTQLNDLSGKGHHATRAVGEDDRGLMFTYDEAYEIAGTIDEKIYTVEAEILVPADKTAHVGTILGNWADSDYFANLNIEIDGSGRPRFRYAFDRGAGLVDWYVDADVRTGEWTHLAFAFNARKHTITCYINGVAIDKVDYTSIMTSSTGADLTADIYQDIPTFTANRFIIGSDNRRGGYRYFQGEIREVTLYSDMRTDDEIKADYAGEDLSDTAIIAHYDVSMASLRQDIQATKGEFDISYYRTWYTEKHEAKDYAYSFAVIGDTQKINVYDAKNALDDTKDDTANMSKIYDWIINNKDEKNIQYVFGLGDITDSVPDDGEAVSYNEWARGQAQYIRLQQAGIPFSVVRGNHDDTVKFNQYFATALDKDGNRAIYTDEGEKKGTEVPDDWYTGQFTDGRKDANGIVQYAGFYNDTQIDNSWITFTVAGTDYLHITLDYGADDAMLAWASKVVTSFPNHKVIITTHAYMYTDGTRLSIGEGNPPCANSDWSVIKDRVYNNGDEMWEKFVSQHGNIFLVLSGHEVADEVVMLQSEGVHGNTVTQLLIDPQDMDRGYAYKGCVGMVAMLYFSNDGKSIEVEWYSTVHNEYYKSRSQFVINLDEEQHVSHDLPDTYKYDEDGHWKECDTCGIIVNEEDHKFPENWTVTKEATQFETGAQKKVCTTCGYTITESTMPLDFGTVVGASVRLTNPTGIRFKLQISEAYKNAIFPTDGSSSGLTLGMFIFPKENLTQNWNNLDHFAPSAYYDDGFVKTGGYAQTDENGKKLTKIDLTFTEYDLYEENGYWYVNGVMTNVYAQNMTREFVGVGYVKKTLEDGTVAYRYSGFDNNSIARSLYNVALKAYQDPAMADYKSTIAEFIEKAIYGTYGVKEARAYEEDNRTYSAVYKYGATEWTSYEDLKAPAKDGGLPITISSDYTKMVVGDTIDLPMTIMVNGEEVTKKVLINGVESPIKLPFVYSTSSSILEVYDGEVTALTPGVQKFTGTFGSHSVDFKIRSCEMVDGIWIDGERDDGYGDFTDTVNMDDNRWYTVDAIKTESGVLIFSQGLFNTTVSTSYPTMCNSHFKQSTNFEFRLSGKDGKFYERYVNASNQAYGVGKCLFDVEERDGKYLHTVELYVNKCDIPNWTDDGEVQLNYGWGTPGETSAILDDTLNVEYVSAAYTTTNYPIPDGWGNSSDWHAYQRLGGLATNYNDFVDNLRISRSGLTTSWAPETSAYKLDGAITSDEIAFYGEAISTEANANGTAVETRGVVKNGDVYLALTITHGAWATYKTTNRWYQNDNIEIYLDHGDRMPIMFFGGLLSDAKDAVMCVPHGVDDAAMTTTIVDGKLVTVVELYFDRDYESCKVKIGMNGLGFAWTAPMWWNDYGYVTASGLSHATTSGTMGTVSLDGNVTLDGEFDKENEKNIWTTQVKENSLYKEFATGSSLTLMATKAEKGVYIGATVEHAKAITEPLKLFDDTDGDGVGEAYYHSYMGLNFYFNGNEDSDPADDNLDENLFRATCLNKTSENRIYSYCKTEGTDGAYTSYFEIFVPYEEIGAYNSDAYVSMSMTARIDDWSKLWNVTNSSNDFNLFITADGLILGEEFTMAEFNRYAATYGTPNCFDLEADEGSSVNRVDQRMRVIFSNKMIAGTEIAFTGDRSVYDWAVNELEEPSQTVEANGENGYDYGWLGMDTYTTKYNRYPVIVVRRKDGAAITYDELAALHSQFAVFGQKISSLDSDNTGDLTDEEYLSQAVTWGNVYHNKIKNRARIIFSIPMKAGTEITFEGSTSTYSWAVCETLHTLKTANVLDSGWLTTNNTYTTQRDGAYLVLTLKKNTDAEFTQAELLGIYDLFTIEGEKSTSAGVYGVELKSINHRGYNKVAPENTLPAYELSAQMGFTYVECDVSFTSDMVPVLLHDSTIDRTSNGTGTIYEMTLEQARQYDYSYGKAGYKNTPIPTFEEFIALCKDLGLHPYIEIKWDSYSVTAEHAKIMVDIVKKYGMEDNVTWISFNSAYLSLIADQDNTARLGIVKNVELTDEHINQAKTLKTKTSGEVFLDVYHTQGRTGATSLTKAKAAGIPLEVWTADVLTDLSKLDPYVTGITSEYLMADKWYYTVTYKNYDDTVLQTSRVAYGGTVNYTGATPVRPGYVFNTGDSKWTKSIDPATGDITYTANFTQATSIAQLLSGEGTEASPYLIENADDLWHLSAMSTGVNFGDGEYYKVTADIDVSDKNWTPICYTGTATGWVDPAYCFQGNFDGNGKTITFNINQPKGYQYGLFAGVSGTVKNLTLNGNMTIKGHSGALAAKVFDGAIITGITNNVNVIGTDSQVGGIVGGLSGDNGSTASFTNCTNNGKVAGLNNVGGINACGYAHITYNNCKNYGAVSGADQVGGITGEAWFDSSFTSCTNSGAITASTSNAGGIVGRVGTNHSGTISDCTNSGTVNAPTNAGGIVGLIDATATTSVSGSINSGAITASGNYAGGIVGYIGAGGTVTISSCTNSGTVDAASGAGGIVGFIKGGTDGGLITVTACTNETTGTVTATGEDAGGIVGSSSWNSDKQILGCTNKANVTGSIKVGGIIGYIYHSDTWTGIVDGACSNSGTITAGTTTATANIGGADAYVGLIAGKKEGSFTYTPAS